MTSNKKLTTWISSLRYSYPFRGTANEDESHMVSFLSSLVFMPYLPLLTIGLGTYSVVDTVYRKKSFSERVFYFKYFFIFFHSCLGRFGVIFYNVHTTKYTCLYAATETTDHHARVAAHGDLLFIAK